MSKRKKGILIGVLVIVLVGGLTTGGIYFSKSRASSAVDIYSMRDIGMDGYWGDESMTGGTVKAERVQSVYVSTTQIVREILVEEGQEVKVGDPLMSYDTTLSNLQLESKKLDIQKLQLNLEKSQKDLEKINKIRAGVPVKDSDLPSSNPGSGISNISTSGTDIQAQKLALAGTSGTPVFFSSPPGAGEDSTADSTEESSPEPTETSPEETDPTDEPGGDVSEYPEAVQGDGTTESPYVFLWQDGRLFTTGLIQHVLQSGQSAYAYFMIREEDQLIGAHLYSWLVAFGYEDGEYGFQIIDKIEQDPMVIDKGVTDGDGGGGIIDGGGSAGGVTFTSAEITKMRSDQELEIRDLTISIQVAEVELKKLEKELTDGTVYSEIDGVIKTLGDPETSAVEKTPLITVSGGGGYYIEGSLNELDLETVTIGQSVTVTSWMSGSTFEGTVQAISEYPTTNIWYYGMGNTNVSYYPFTVFVGDDAALQEGEGVEMKYSAAQEGNPLYVMTPFVRTENGQSYVMVDAGDGTLVRRNVTTGKEIWNQFTQIYNGLTMEDKVAFPYGKDVKEGAPTKAGSIDTLYSSMSR